MVLKSDDPTDGIITIENREAKFAANLLRRHVEWNPTLDCALVTSQSHLSCYAVLPSQVMSRLDLRVRTLGVPPGERAVFRASGFLQQLTPSPESEADVRVDMSRLTHGKVQIGTPLSLEDLPPNDGWQMPIHGIASDLMQFINEAVNATNDVTDPVKDKSIDLGSRSSRAWSGLPMDLLLTARRLRLITDEPLRVTASTNGPWKRLATPRGQVFVLGESIERRARLRSGR